MGTVEQRCPQLFLPCDCYFLDVPILPRYWASSVPRYGGIGWHRFLVVTLGRSPPQADLRQLRTTALRRNSFMENFTFLYGEMPLRPLESRMDQSK